MQHIRIPTPNAPAAHHLTFICAVAELAHRVLESVTGLNVDLHVGIHQHVNVEREPALTVAAAAAGLRYDEYNTSAWHTWTPANANDTTRVTIYTTQQPAPVARHLCADANCEDYALAGGSFCAAHEAELRAECGVNATVTLAPETTIEYAQLTTAQLETLAAQYTAANDARREG